MGKFTRLTNYFLFFTVVISLVLSSSSVIANSDITFENDGQMLNFTDTLPFIEYECTLVPALSEQSDNELLGRWEFVSGSFIWYFASHDDIEFFADGWVTEYAFNEPGRFTIIDGNHLSVTGDWDNITYYFTYVISGDVLIITDEDGDRGVWIKAGSAPILFPTVQYNHELLGRWEYVSGECIWYFASDGDIEFFANGRVREYAFNEPGRFTIIDDNHLSATGAWDNITYQFTYDISGDILTITDVNGDRGVWRRVG
ncbi:MAG: hypothetical protein FWE27_03290 [Defluviitaleaceae bacterium]|nr:hypothetical protein [Defluviitaleaceae bacterium]